MAADNPVIDAHAHHVPPELLDALQSGRLNFPGIEVVAGDGGRALSFAGGAPTRPVSPPLLDLERRHQWMDEQGIKLQVVAGWLDIFGYELEPAEGEEWARVLTEHLRAAADADGRLIALGTVAMQDPERAAHGLREIVASGLPGIMIATQIGERELDEPEFAPFWQAADETGAVVYLHPSFAASPRHRVHGLVNGLARAEDTTVTLARLLYADVPARYPAARIIASHGGGALPFVIGRLARNQSAVTTEVAAPQHSLAHLYFDSVVFEPASLRLLLEVAAPGHVLLGSDYPFPIGDLAPRAVIAAAELEPEVAAAIESGTAAQLFGVNTAQARSA